MSPENPTDWSNRSFPVLALGLALIPACWAQEGSDDRPDARTNPILTDFSADEDIRNRLARPAGGISVSPSGAPTVQQVAPNAPLDPNRYDFADGTQRWLDGPQLRAEGTFLVGWRGELVRLRTGGLAFLPVTESGSDRPEPPIGLVPCRAYDRLESLLGEDTGGLWITLTGEVLIYQERNWILPTVFAASSAPGPDELRALANPTDSGSEVDTEATPPREDQTNQPPGEVPPDAQPDIGVDPALDPVEALIQDLEAERDARRGIDTTFAPRVSPDAGADPDVGPRVDGRMMLSQRARMVRSVEGGWIVTLDNDGQAGDERQLPNNLRLLPCLIVHDMERRAESKGESWTFEVSGNLYRYRNEVYLLPRMFVSLPDDDVRPLQ